MRIKQYIKRAAPLALMVAILAPVQEAWGQVTGNRYSSVSLRDVEVSFWSSSNVRDVSNIFDGRGGNYATINRDQTGLITVDAGDANGIGQVVVNFSGNGYYRASRVTVLTSNNANGSFSQIGSVYVSSNAQTIPLTGTAQQYIQLSIEARDGYWNTRISSIAFQAPPTIQHKPAKWYSFLESISDEAKKMDTFDDDASNAMFEAVMSSSKDIQAAHTYIDTIYMHKGTSIVLNLPDKMDNGNLSSTSYQRWYSYRTGLTFATGETRNNAVVDLLTPIDDGTFYRFGNGYVGSPIGTNMHRANFYFPNDDEYKEWFGDAYGEYRDNSWYVVACDVSLYNDFAKDYRFGGTTFSATDPREPTLSHRIIFYICAVEPPAPDEDGNPVEDVNWYRKAVNSSDYSGSGTKYLEEYDISFPYTRVSNNTLDLVALSKDARSYAVPVGADSDSDELTVTLIDGTGNEASGIKLASTVVPNGNGTNNDYVGKQTIYPNNSYKISGNTRAIQFQYPKLQTDGTRRVNNTNAKATILVTKEVNGTSYHIAKFNLTFVPETRLLTQSQLAGAGTSSQWYFRTDDYISKNFELLTSLDFDYSKSVPNTAYPNGNEHFYPFPMSWESNSYGFYDGAQDDDIQGTSQNFPQWGYYSIMDNFIETDHWSAGHSVKAEPLANSTYHLYVDASDRPGVIARLEFDRQLCRGAELFVTAWVKNCVWNADDLHSDAGMLFTIMGVTEDGRYVPIYRHNTGQIRQTNFLADTQTSLHSNIVDYHPVTIDGSTNNEWYQVYFSFINKNDLSFEKYVLQIDNSSLSTEGGDMYLDDIRVYMAMPNAYVEQLAPSCIGDATSIRLRIDWDRLLSRTGDEELQSGSGTRNLSFCFVDRYAYEEALAGGATDNEAIQAAMVAFSRDEEGGGEGTKIGTLTYDLYYEGNKAYDTSDDARGENGGNAFYRYQEEGNTEDRFLAIDLWATDLIPTRRYYLLIDETGSGNASNFAIADPCAIKTEFMVESTTLIKMNGQVVTPETEFCVGQVFNFTAQLRIDNQTEEGIPVTTPVYFDWYFGSVDDYLSTNNTHNVSIEDALANFRGIYPDAEAVSKELTPPVASSGDYSFTDEMFNLLSDVTASGAAEGLNAKLVLRKQNLNISILKDGLFLVIRPIQTVIYDEEGEVVDPKLICWSYVPLNLKTTSEAPHANTGFWEVNQPDGYAAALRIGLKQIQSGKRLTLDLRDVECATEGATRLEMVTSTMGSEGQLVGVDLTDIFLVGTTDPDMQPYIDQSTSEYDLPIGKLIALNATEKRESTMTIEFDLNLETNGFKFKPHEGYEYTFEVHFQEDIPNGTDKETIAACYGKMPVTMKVVPEYLVWNDTQKTEDYSTIGNWNNDGNWQRIPSGRIHAEESDDSEYFTNVTNDTPNAFVPMLFSKVVIPANSKIWLYQAGYGENGSWVNSDRPEEVADPTLNIQYDLMAFDNTNGLTTEHYRVSLLDEIHFEPGAEMKHAEYLLYNKAWVDYKLDGGRWYTLASPLKAVYAGDFYTDSDDGVEKQEYFTDITFTGNAQYNNGAVTNNRFKPSVYQRAWKGESTEVWLHIDATTKKNVAISGNWSALTNDVVEKYEPGTGFSLKVQDLPTSNTTGAIFRLPKADDSYTYYSQHGQPSENTTSVSRVEREGTENVSGRLKTDAIMNRKVVGDATLYTSFTVPLADEHGGYYLVGNPFMAHLDMEAFFNENTSFDEKYWLVTNGNQSAAVGTPDNSWISVGENSTAKIAPLQSFFVKLKTDEETSNFVTAPRYITFTQDMQTLGDGGTNDGLRSANALTITATTTDGRTSRAAVAYSGMASDDYQSSEDAELFLDSNLGDVPMVYTVAGTMASSINVRQNCELVPLGVYGARNEQVTLRFDQVGVFSGVKLYDAQTKRYTTLTEGSEVSVSTNDSGRYYLTGGLATGSEAIRTVDDISIYSVRPGEIVATSAGSSLRSVRVYGIGGELVAQQSLANQSVYRLRVPGNAIYVVYAEDMDGIIRNVKLRVR